MLLLFSYQGVDETGEINQKELNYIPSYSSELLNLFTLFEPKKTEMKSSVFKFDCLHSLIVRLMVFECVR